MGSVSSKFRKHLQNGDEVAALQLYNNNSDLRKALDASSSYGDSYQHETPLHFAARHGMKSLLRIFLSEHGGNPNKTNSRNETALHCVCIERNSQYCMVKRRRLQCLQMILAWRGPLSSDGEIEKVDLASQDSLNNTALHYAAGSGLQACVELLVQYSAPLFVENNEGYTPCDSAEKSEHGVIALYLESKMVFSNEENIDDVEEVETPVILNEDYSGLRAQDLQEAKDHLLVETADMLNIPLFTAEALLRNHEWSREMLLEEWMSNAVLCCEKSGVTIPPSLYCDKPQVALELSTPTSPSNTEGHFFDELTCDICLNQFPASEECLKMSCEHPFCRSCWMQYLTQKIQDGDAHDITCPAFDCARLVPVEIIENVVSRDIARKYLQFDIQAFVERNPLIKWCPYPGCGNAVKLPDIESSASPTVKNFPNAKMDSSHAVDCGNGHMFCWECLGEAHEPCSCENWKKWCDKVADVKPETLHGTEAESEMAANCLWLVTNSKPCPNCKSPIQKNEGCNHMKCLKCKHDFCWVCLEQWKRHNSSTGGYFKCNRYEAVGKVREAGNAALSDAEQNNSRLQELNRFVHYYTRFKNHENSYRLEEPLMNTARDKMLKLAEAVTDLASASEETKFVENAVVQLLTARRILRFSYIYGYYIDGPGYKKIVFEFMQTELEETTEILSQMVNRLYLRTPRKKIIDQAVRVQRKRKEFLSAIEQGLVPAETPPSLRKKHRRKYSMESEDEEMRQVILASIDDFDVKNPWIKDATGKHTNVMALLDWPHSDDSDEGDDSAARTDIGTCARNGCTKLKARNPRLGGYHEHCSLQCLCKDNSEKSEEKEDGYEGLIEERLEFLRAMEMSRLQYLQDTGIIKKSTAESARDNDLLNSDLPSTSGLQPGCISDCAEDDWKKPTELLRKQLDLALERVISVLQPNEVDPDVRRELESQKWISLPTTPAIQPSPRLQAGGKLHSLQTLDSYTDKTFFPDTKMIINDKSAGACGGSNPDDAGTSDESKHFGLVKHLTVQNIHSADVDKTKDFLEKDLKKARGSRNVKHISTVPDKNASCSKYVSENCYKNSQDDGVEINRVSKAPDDIFADQRASPNLGQSSVDNLDMFTQVWLQQTLRTSDHNTPPGTNEISPASPKHSEPVISSSVRNSSNSDEHREDDQEIFISESVHL